MHALDLARALATEDEVHVFGRARRGEQRVTNGRLGALGYTAFTTHERGRRAERASRTCFERLLREWRPDVVHIHHLRNLSLSLPRLARSAGVPVVFTLHDHSLECGRFFLADNHWQPCTGPGLFKCWACLTAVPRLVQPGPDARAVRGPARFLERLDRRQWWRSSPPVLRLRRRRLRAMVDHVDCFISPSRHLRERVLRAFRLPADRVLLSPHGLDHAGFVRRRGPLPGRLRFGFVGAVDFHKGCHVLLEAFARGVPAELVVVGRVAERFTAFFRSRAWPGVRLRSPVDPTERATIYDDFDVLVMPSVCRENWPLAVQEAFLCGLPVVGSKIGGIAELLESGGGVVVPPGDAELLRRVLCDLAEAPARVAELRRNIPPVRHVDDQAAEMRRLYTGLRR